MPYNMIILYFRLPYLHIKNSALFSTQYFSTLILYRRSLETYRFDSQLPSSIKSITIINDSNLSLSIYIHISIYTYWVSNHLQLPWLTQSTTMIKYSYLYLQIHIRNMYMCSNWTSTLYAIYVCCISCLWLYHRTAWICMHVAWNFGMCKALIVAYLIMNASINSLFWKL